MDEFWIMSPNNPRPSLVFNCDKFHYGSINIIKTPFHELEWGHKFYSLHVTFRVGGTNRNIITYNVPSPVFPILVTVKSCNLNEEPQTNTEVWDRPGIKFVFSSSMRVGRKGILKRTYTLFSGVRSFRVEWKDCYNQNAHSSEWKWDY